MNMSLIGFLPILIILFIVIIIGSFTARSMKRKVNNRTRSMSGKWVRWIFAGYISLLLICVIFISVIPEKNMNDFKKAPIGSIEKEGVALVDAAATGKIDSINSDFIEKKWNLNFLEQKLNVRIENDEFIDTQIFVERKKTNDHKIEIVYYKTRSSVNDMDVTKLTNPLFLKLAGNTLTINNPKKAKLKFSMFNNVFAVNQFTGETSLFEHHSSFFEGQSILYMRIPKDLELINKPDINIQFVK